MIDSLVVYFFIFLSLLVIERRVESQSSILNMVIVLASIPIVYVNLYSELTAPGYFLPILLFYLISVIFNFCKGKDNIVDSLMFFSTIFIMSSGSSLYLILIKLILINTAYVKIAKVPGNQLTNKLYLFAMFIVSLFASRYGGSINLMELITPFFVLSLVFKLLTVQGEQLQLNIIEVATITYFINYTDEFVLSNNLVALCIFIGFISAYFYIKAIGQQTYSNYLVGFFMIHYLLYHYLLQSNYVFLSLILMIVGIVELLSRYKLLSKLSHKALILLFVLLLAWIEVKVMNFDYNILYLSVFIKAAGLLGINFLPKSYKLPKFGTIYE